MDMFSNGNAGDFRNFLAVVEKQSVLGTATA